MQLKIHFTNKIWNVDFIGGFSGKIVCVDYNAIKDSGKFEDFAEKKSLKYP